MKWKKSAERKKPHFLLVFLVLINKFASDVRIFCRSDVVLQGMNVLMS